MSFLKDKTTVSDVSYRVVKKIADKIDKEITKEEMLLAQVLAPNYDKKLLYITNRAYLQARVWPLSLLSLGLISPKDYYAEVITIPSFCPNVITDNFEAANFYNLNNLLPVREDSTMVQIEEDRSLAEFTFTSFGEHRKSIINTT